MIRNTIGVDIKIVPNGDAWLVDQRIREAVAKRAFQIFESRGRSAGQEQQDWILAESEVVRPLSYGLLETEDAVEVGLDVGRFDARSGIEIVTEPHRLILGGFERVSNQPSKPEATKGLRSQIFGIVPLPTTVDATKIESDLKGRVLRIRILKVARPVPTYCGQVESGAA